MSAQQDALKKQVEDQLNRLLSQLEDLEELREDLDDDEYEETKKETMDQLKEFDQSLKKMMAGDVGLVTQLASMKLAIQAAVQQAFKTPEVIRMFAKGEHGQLRERFTQLERQQQLGKVSEQVYQSQGVEILSALKRLGEELTPGEEAFLQKFKTTELAAFEEL